MSPHERATVTVVIPTWNRADYLVECLGTVLGQVGVDPPDLAVLVHDNASTDDTAARLAAIDDERIEHRINDTNVGFFRNWKLGLEAVRSPYVAFLQDDDRWQPGFLAAALAALDRSDEVAFAFSDVDVIDEEGRVLGQRSSGLPPGRFAGLDYLERVVDGDNVVIDSSAGVMRTEVLRAVGGFDHPHMTHDIVFNYQFRMSAGHDLVRVPEPLTQIRTHASQIHHADAGGVAAIGMVAERMDAAAFLLGSPRAAEPSYRAWLADRLVQLNRLRSQYTAEELPSLTAPAADRLDLAVDDLLAAVPAGATVAVAGDDLLDHGRLDAARRRGAIEIRPFPEIDGFPAGPPASSADAIKALADQAADGVEYLAVAWPSFWWLDFYHGWRDRLRADDPLGRPLVDNSRIVVHRLPSRIRGGR